MLKIASNLSLPSDAVTQTFAVLAKRGAGKSYTAGVLVEEMLAAGHQVVVVDPTGAWWGLRLDADGKSKGLDVFILGGERGDAALDVGSGRAVADFAVDERASFVLDLSGFRKREQVRFMTDFCEQLYHRCRLPIHLVVDEADAFAPQRPMDGQERLLGAMEDIVRRGRIRGLGVTLVSQRSAVLNKNVLTQIECLIALRTLAPQDKAAMDAWIRENADEAKRDEFMASLATLPTGTAWFWSPSWLEKFMKVKVRSKDTFDSGATPRGSRAAASAKPVPIDIEKLKTKMADAVAKAEANDPEKLKAKVAMLEKKLASKPVAAAAQPIANTNANGIIKPVQKVAADLFKLCMRLESVLGQVKQARDAVAPIQRAVVEAASASLTLPRRVVAKPTSFFGIGPERMLDRLKAEYPDAVTKQQLGLISGYAYSGGTFRTYLAKLKAAGEAIELSDAKIVAARGGASMSPDAGSTIWAAWRERVGKGPANMISVLENGGPMDKYTLGERSGYESGGGTFRTYLALLKRMGIVDVDSNMVSLARLP